MSSFPYMAIAKKHGLDYGALLRYTDFFVAKRSKMPYREFDMIHDALVASPKLDATFTAVMQQTKEARRVRHP